MTIIAGQPATASDVLAAILNAQTSAISACSAIIGTIAALRNLTSSSSYSVVVVQGYYATGDGGGGIYMIKTTDTSSSDNGGTIIVDTVGRRWYLQTNGRPVSVKQFGAKGDGVTDDAPAIRACITACNSILFPGGASSLYLLGSQQASNYAYVEPINVVVRGKSNFEIIGEPGATLVMSNSANLGAQLMFAQCKNFRVSGLTHQGNRTGLNPTLETDAYYFNSCTDFLLENVYLSGDWSGRGCVMAGDWLVRGMVRNVIGDSVGLGIDVAYLYNCTFKDIDLTGTGNAPGSGVGYIGISVIDDHVADSDNTTGVSFTTSQGNNFIDINIANYTTGMSISSGRSYTIRGGHIHNNPGLSTAPGIGILIIYYPASAGYLSSVGSPVTTVYIDGVELSGNGSTVAGYGIYIDGSAITNSDLISGILVDGCRFINNRSTGIDINGAAHVASVRVSNCYFNGGLQTTEIGTGILTGMVSANTPLNSVVLSNIGYSAEFLTVALPTGIGTGNGVVNTYPFPVIVTIYTNTATYTPVVSTASASKTLGAVAANSTPVTFVLMPGMSISFSDTIPSAWDWTALS